MTLWQTRKSTFSEKTAAAGSAECHSRPSFITWGDSSADSVGLEEAEHRTTQKEKNTVGMDSQRERESETIYSDPIISKGQNWDYSDTLFSENWTSFLYFSSSMISTWALQWKCSLLLRHAMATGLLGGRFSKRLQRKCQYPNHLKHIWKPRLQAARRALL